jgi:hypothetical protein
MSFASKRLFWGKPERMDANMKWIGWLIRWAAGALLAAALSVMTTFYMVESYMEALLDRWNLGSVQSPDLDLGRLFSLNRMPDGTGAAGGGHPSADSAKDADALREAGHERVPGGALKVDASPGSGDRGERFLATESRAGEQTGPGDGSRLSTGEGNGGTGQTGGSSGSVLSGEAGTNTAGAGDGVRGAETGKRSQNGQTPSGASAAPSGSGVRTESGSEPEPEALPVFGRAALQGGLVMSAEEFNEKRKNLSEEDKVEIFTILLNHVPQEELQRLSVLVEDGITAEEAVVITEVMEDYLGPAEMERLIAILGSE